MYQMAPCLCQWIVWNFQRWMRQSIYCWSTNTWCNLDPNELKLLFQSYRPVEGVLHPLVPHSSSREAVMHSQSYSVEMYQTRFLSTHVAPKLTGCLYLLHGLFLVALWQMLRPLRGRITWGTSQILAWEVACLIAPKFKKIFRNTSLDKLTFSFLS